MLFRCIVCEVYNIFELLENPSTRSAWQPALQRYVATIIPHFARASNASFSLSNRYIDPLLHLLESVCSAACGEGYDSCDEAERPFVRCGAKTYTVKKSFSQRSTSITPSNASCRRISVAEKDSLLRSKTIAAAALNGRSNAHAVREIVSATRLIQKMIKDNCLTQEVVLQVKSFSPIYFHINRFLPTESLRVLYSSARKTVIVSEHCIVVALHFTACVVDV